MRDAVEAVPAYSEVAIPALGDRVAPGDLRQRGIVGGVEHADERHARRQACAHARDDGERRWVVERCQLIERREGRELGVAEARGGAEALAAVHDAVHAGA